MPSNYDIQNEPQSHEGVLNYMRAVWEPYALVRTKDSRLVPQVTDMSLPEFEALVIAKGLDLSGCLVGPAFIFNGTRNWDNLVACRVTRSHGIED